MFKKIKNYNKNVFNIVSIRGDFNFFLDWIKHKMPILFKGKNCLIHVIGLRKNIHNSLCKVMRLVSYYVYKEILEAGRKV